MADALLNEVLAAYAFSLDSQFEVDYGGGHINRTLLLTVNQHDHTRRRYIVQRINRFVFKKPEEVMDNIVKVTDYLRRVLISRGIDTGRRLLNVYPTSGGLSFFQDSSGETWRVYDFIEDTVCLQSIDDPELFYRSGLAFGRFQHLLDGYPADSLFETIPRFHDTPDRLAFFRQSVQRDAQDLAGQVAEEIEFVLSREADCRYLIDLQRSGALPTRVTHNDTKLNNVLFDAESGEAICVIDLDTVMPGLVAYDFGDAIRFGATTAAEDEPDLDKVHFDLGLYEQFTRGFLEEAGKTLTPLEIETLPWGARLMTLEVGMRFLGDYLNGDVYFRIHRPGQNLDRARTQIRLVQEMEHNWDAMGEIVARYRALNS